MAYSVIETKIANPARASGKGKRKMAAKHKKKLSAKQIRFFGTPAQKAALKRSRAAKRGAKHRTRTKKRNTAMGYRGSAGHRAATKKKKQNAGIHSHKQRSQFRSKKRSSKPKKRNPVPQIISWVAGNPAKRSKKKVAAHKHHKKKSSAKRNAGRPRSKKSTTVRRRRHHNPAGLGKPIDWVTGGVGVLAGGVGSRMIPQMLMGPSNTGWMGYLANAATAVGLGFLSHSLFPKQPILTVTVIAGGFGGLISRIVSDRTQFGAALSLTGLGDWGLGLYQKSNFPYPQRIQGARGPASSLFTWGDGSQGVPSLATAGADSTMAC